MSDICLRAGKGDINLKNSTGQFSPKSIQGTRNLRLKSGPQSTSLEPLSDWTSDSFEGIKR